MNTNSAVKTARASILENLAPLFQKAEREGLWFYCSYQQLWFTPAELREQHKKGRFIWGPVNWQLRMPRERLEEAQRKADAAMAELHGVLAKAEGQ